MIKFEPSLKLLIGVIKVINLTLMTGLRFSRRMKIFVMNSNVSSIIKIYQRLMIILQKCLVILTLIWKSP